MSEAATGMPLRALLAADLLANTGRRGLRGGIAAWLTDPSSSTVLARRVSAALHRRGVRVPGRLLWRFTVAFSGCHIHPGAVIGPGLRLPHPVGLTIGVGARLGASVTVYQNATIGAGYRDGPYPTVEAGAVILPGAVVAGGIKVGAGAVMGAAPVVIRDVPARAVVAGNPATVLRTGCAPNAPCSRRSAGRVAPDRPNRDTSPRSTCCRCRSDSIPRR